MFNLENIKKLKTSIIGISLIGSAFLISGCNNSDVKLATDITKSDDRSVDGAVKYNKVHGMYGPYFVNTQDTTEYNSGREATPREIRAWDVDIKPDGTGLPKYDMHGGDPVLDENGNPKIAKGTVEWGEELYDAQCGMCHGEFGAGGKGYPTLAGGKKADLVIQRLNPADNPPNPDVALKTIGSYWPYASTLFWYIYDSMPFTAPKTLTFSETYAITAFLLSANEITVDGEEMDGEFELSQANFNKIKMPNEDGFYPEVDTKDPHQGPANMKKLLSDPTIYGKGTKCMENCFEKEHGKGTTVDDLMMKIKIPLVENINEGLSSERSWKEPKTADCSDANPEMKKAYDTYCSACHSNKAIGAPVIGDKAAWGDILEERSLEEVYENGIVGINAMPPKGTAMDMSDEDFKKLVDYIIGQSK